MATTRPNAPSVNSGLASEFYVAHLLYRMGLVGVITYGNAKALDIIAANPADNRTATLEVKSTKYKTNLPIRLRDGPPKGNHFFVLVAYDRWSDLRCVPRIWVIPASKISTMLKPWSKNAKATQTCVRYRDLTDLKVGGKYEDAWRLLFPGRREQAPIGA